MDQFLDLAKGIFEHVDKRKLLVEIILPAAEEAAKDTSNSIDDKLIEALRLIAGSKVLG